MDLNRRLAEAAVRRIAVLLVTVPGWATTRFAAERTLRERGGRIANSAADADVLVICGAPGDRLSAAVEHVWAQMPGPRARVTAMTPAATGAAFDQAVAELLDVDHQGREAADRPTEPAMGTPAEEDDEQDRDAEEPADRDSESGDSETADGTGRADPPGFDDPTLRGADAPNPETSEQAEGGAKDHGDMGDMDHGDMGDVDHGDMGDMDHGDMGDMGDMDHGDMEMAPGGIALAEGGEEDRDGLDLDVLHLPLGPVLPWWPAGLLLHCTVHGDVVMDARPELLGAADDSVPGPGVFGTPADRLDRAAHVLVLAGWEAAAVDAIRLRDDLLAGSAEPSHRARLDRLVNRVRRSRLLRWSLRGAGPIAVATCRDLGLDERVAGDVHDRLVTLLTDARSALDGDEPTTPLSADVLPRLVTGLELGAVRLLIASLDLDTDVRTTTAMGAR